MATELHVHRRIWLDGAGETAAEGRQRLPAGFPKATARRLSHLATLYARVLEELDPTGDDALIMVSAYSETRSLEAYLDSFPHPSPMLFQTSVHPAPVQGACVARQRALGEFWPITGAEERAARALELAALSPARRILVVAGEEEGSWLTALGLASAEAWAMGLELRRDPAGALGTLREQREPEGQGLTGRAAFAALARESSAWLAAPGGGGWSWQEHA